MTLDFLYIIVQSLHLITTLLLINSLAFFYHFIIDDIPNRIYIRLYSCFRVGSTLSVHASNVVIVEYIVLFDILPSKFSVFNLLFNVRLRATYGLLLDELKIQRASRQTFDRFMISYMYFMRVMLFLLKGFANSCAFSLEFIST